MDYYSEIVDSPDIKEALGRLKTRDDYPKPLMVSQFWKDPKTKRRLEFSPISVTHPSVWRAELVNWFHLHPDFAAEVWRQVAALRLARTAGLLPWPPKLGSDNARAAKLFRWLLKLKSDKAILGALGLRTDMLEEEFKRKLADVTDEQLEATRRDLGVEELGPEFIEKLIDAFQKWLKDKDNLKIARQGLARLKLEPDLINLLIEADKAHPRRVQKIVRLIRKPEAVVQIAKWVAVPVPFSMMLEQELNQIAQYRTDSGRSMSGAEDSEEGDDPESSVLVLESAGGASGGAPPHGPGPPVQAPANAGGEGGAAPPPVIVPEEDKRAPLRRALAGDLVGLAFSGGGIRSATFNLGVLQTLAKLNVLRHCDYLSTVSGGGYIGSWFTAWTHKESHDTNHNRTLTAVETQDCMRVLLSPTNSPRPLASEVRPIRYLREFSNYLTPQSGFFSADTWTMVAIYLRNLLLNLLVLLPLIAAVLLIPRLAISFIALHPNVLFVVTMCLALLPLAFLPVNLWRTSSPPNPDQMSQETSGRVDVNESNPDQVTRKPSSRADVDNAQKPPWYASQGGIQLLVVVPLLFGACLIATLYWHGVDALREKSIIDLNQYIFDFSFKAGVVFCCYLAAINFLMLRSSLYWNQLADAFWSSMSVLSATFGGAAAAGGLFWVLGKVFVTFPDIRFAVAFGTPLTLAAYSFAVAIQLGLLGTKFPDHQREWWSRLRAWTLIYSVAWTVLFTFAIWVPDWLDELFHEIGTEYGVAALGAWALATYLGIHAGRTVVPPETGDRSVKTRAQSVVSLVAPYLFVGGLLAIVSLGVEEVLERLCACELYPSVTLFAIAAVLLGISFFISWRIGINEFSMHHFYKNRLVRCYLGASRWQSRKADWFTGFDPNDDVPLSQFDHEPPPSSKDKIPSKENEQPSGKVKGPMHPGPYPIVNATLNLVAGEDLAWQERKATSFVFTPKYCGYDVDRAVLRKKDGNWPDAYAPTMSYLSEGVGPTLGTAMAVSGAAANPNMGKVTTGASAFLLTVFNVRLGWWLPNPRRKGWFAWDRSGPALGLPYTVIELFGMTDDKKKYINVSDGGHFENLGVYELIRRGCRYIIASDAGQDGSCGLEDLSNLIRKCRTDFGVEIDIGMDPIRDRDVKSWSSTHCVVGKIHYLNMPQLNKKDGSVICDDNGQPKHEEGLLVFIKPTITGDEPFDILEYFKRVPAFPHESTADQWFNESQFESYRRLGMHIAEMTFQRFRANPDERVKVEEFFDNLKNFWHPPSPKVVEYSMDHCIEYTRILELIRSQKNLSFLDPALFENVKNPEIKTIPAGLAGRRDEFYVCNALIQLIENVYADLDLEHNYDHPHVKGWMDVFKYWAKEPPFQRTWALSKNTYALRFRQFFDDRLSKETQVRRQLPWIVAHRGDISGGHENTLPAFRAAINNGADMIEFDVHRLVDGVPVVFHDDKIAGTALAGIDHRQLRDFARAGGLEVPTLDEALAFCAKRIPVAVEFKSGWQQKGVESAVVEAMSKAEITSEEYLLCSFDCELMLRVRALHRNIRTALLTEDVGFEEAQQLLDDVAANMWAPDFATLTDDVLKRCEQHEISVLPWTVNDDQDMRRFLSANSIVGIITDRTHDALELRRTMEIVLRNKQK